MRASGRVRLGAAAVVATLLAIPQRAPASAPAPSPLLSDDACMACHADAARTWRGSLHHASASNTAYETAVFAEPLPFCRSCHAPHGDPARETADRAREAGITCTTCHVRPGKAGTVLAALREGPISAPHPVERTAAIGEAVCVRCHEFDFPDRRGERMQKTATEHRASPSSATSCAACHMPSEAGRRSHQFSASRDTAFLARAISVRAERDRDRVRFILEPQGVGHAFPTGDLFRRLALTVKVEDAAGRTLTTKRRYFARVFAPTRSGNEIVRREIADERLFARTEVTFDVDPSSTTVRWEVDYERVAFSPTRYPEQAVLDGSVALAQGMLRRAP